MGLHAPAAAIFKAGAYDFKSPEGLIFVAAGPLKS